MPPAAPTARASSARGSRREVWPERDLQITAVEAETGEFTVFTRDSGVDVVSAVAASCAVPTVWPPVAINGHHYIDGGMRSAANVDLAAGADRVVVLAPLAAGLQQAHLDPRAAGEASRRANGRSSRPTPRRWPPSARTSSTRPSVPTRRAPDCASRPDLVDEVRHVWSSS